jgi:hypothetical protein
MKEKIWLHAGEEITQCRRRCVSTGGGEVAQWRKEEGAQCRRRDGSMREKIWLNAGEDIAQCRRRGGSM